MVRGSLTLKFVVVRNHVNHMIFPVPALLYQKFIRLFCLVVASNEQQDTLPSFGEFISFLLEQARKCGISHFLLISESIKHLLERVDTLFPFFSRDPYWLLLTVQESFELVRAVNDCRNCLIRAP